MTREATPELGGRKAPGIMGRGYKKTRSEEVAPAMRGARTLLDVEGFARALELYVSFDDGGVVRLARHPYARVGFHCFCTLNGYLAPGFVAPNCANSLSA